MLTLSFFTNAYLLYSYLTDLKHIVADSAMAMNVSSRLIPSLQMYDNMTYMHVFVLQLTWIKYWQTSLFNTVCI